MYERSRERKRRKKKENGRKELLEKAEMRKEQLRSGRKTEDQDVVKNLVNRIERREKRKAEEDQRV